MLRRALLSASHSDQVRRLVETAPVSRDLVRRFVPGAALDDALRIAGTLTDEGLLILLNHLGEETRDAAMAKAAAEDYIRLVTRIGEAGMIPHTEISLKLSSLGQLLPADGEKIALDHAWRICAAAAGAGTKISFDMEDHTFTDSTLTVLRELRADFQDVGVALQAALRRTEADCRDLAGAGSRVRLCKGAYAEPVSVAFTDRMEIDISYVRCLKVLMAGAGYPMVATHDPRLIDIAGALAVRNHRAQGSYEYQMLYGVRPAEQRRLAAAGERMRVYVPYGDQWYGYFMRRLAERPANTAFFLRSLVSKG